MRVYIVTSGGFRDYQIEAVRASRESAEAYIGKNPTTDLRIEEWEVTGGVRHTGDCNHEILTRTAEIRQTARQVADICGSLGVSVENAKRNLAAYCEHLKRCMEN